MFSAPPRCDDAFVSELLIDRHLPVWDFDEVHRRRVAALPDVAYAAARHLDFSRSWITRTLLLVRGLRVDPTIDGLIEKGDFVVVVEHPPQEYVLWMEPASLEIAWNFHVAGIGDGRSEVTTMTRVRCLTATARRRFRIYWFFVRPFSGLIRRELLRCVAASAEA